MLLKAAKNAYVANDEGCAIGDELNNRYERLQVHLRIGLREVFMAIASERTGAQYVSGSMIWGRDHQDSFRSLTHSLGLELACSSRSDSVGFRFFFLKFPVTGADTPKLRGTGTDDAVCLWIRV